MFDFIVAGLSAWGLGARAAWVAAMGVTLGMIVFLIWIAGMVSRRVFIPAVEKAVLKTSNKWDDAMVGRGVFVAAGWLPPFVGLYFAAEMFLPPGAVAVACRRLAMAAVVLVGIGVLRRVIDAVADILRDRRHALSWQGYLEAGKIVVYVLGGVFLVAVLVDKSPWGILTLFGGLTAVLILVFKDIILGLVASVQLSAKDMVRVGDWIEMPSHGADGDVIEISIHTVKVRNWDKTISSIPTHALVSGSFKNWRGMSDSGGRRIKRAVNIDLNSIRFCTPEMLARFATFPLLADYVRQRQAEIESHNRSCGLDGDMVVGARRQTNIGVFRAYVVAWLKANPLINKDMTFLVRQLPPGPQGLPLEIYVFSSDKVWANYEAIQADIFDHLLAVMPEFGLRPFQYPAGFDFT